MAVRACVRAGEWFVVLGASSAVNPAPIAHEAVVDAMPRVSILSDYPAGQILHWMEKQRRLVHSRIFCGGGRPIDCVA